LFFFVGATLTILINIINSNTTVFQTCDVCVFLKLK
jgi:hypothetical protein